MGYIRHDAVVAVVSDYHSDTIAQIERFRDGMDEEFRKYLVGPVVGVNGYHAYCFLPDGSKEGWEHSDTAQDYRDKFAAVVTGFRHGDGSGPGDAVALRFGGDEPELLTIRDVADSA